MPDKGWENEDMFVPPGYHIDAAVEGGETSPKEEGQVPYVFPSGVGGVLMNGCWGTDYKPNDPCYNSKATSTICSVSGRSSSLTNSSNRFANSYCIALWCTRFRVFGYLLKLDPALF